MDQFQRDPKVRVYLGQIAANAEAITLSAANRCVLVEPAWTANLNVQAGQRILAPGKHAVVQFATLANTLDEAMVARHLREVRMAQEVYATRRADTRTIAR